MIFDMVIYVTLIHLTEIITMKELSISFLCV